MKKLIVILLVGTLMFSCGGGGEESVMVETEVNTAPTIPNQVFPLDNTICTDNNIIFEWNSSLDAESNAISYRIEISENINFSPIIKAETSFALSRLITLDKGKAYYWRIKALDSNNAESDFSSTMQFVTEGEGVSNNIPFAPSLVAPELNSEIAGTSTTLSWSASDVDGDTLTYDVYLDTNENPTTLVSENQSNTTYGANNLNAASTYYFKVVAKDGNGGNSIGQIWSFTTN